MYIYTLTTNRIMITDAQVFTALVIALISGLLAIRLGTRLYI
jgi:photosystem I reaction center subunit XII